MNEVEKILFFVFPVFFVLVWSSVLRMLSVMSGWTKLAECFHYPDKFQGKYYRFQSARIKKINFNGALEMGVNEDGLYLIPMVLFRLFHKPLLIPWDEIDAEPFKKFLSKGYRLTLRSFPEIKIEMDHQNFEKMITHLKEQMGFHSAGSDETLRHQPRR